VDFGVGVLLLAFGTVAWLRRRESRTGAWMGLAGGAWFAGTLGWPVVALHRAPLVMLHLSYPSGRLPRPWLARAAVAASLVAAVLPPLARNDRVTVVVAALVAVAALRVFRGSGGVDRQAAIPALLAAVTFAGILSLGAALRLAGVEAQRPVLWAYDLVIAGLAAVLLVDLLRARWSQAVLRGLVVDLGDLHDSALQHRLARALGDPTLVVGIWAAERGSYLDEAGAPVDPPPFGSRRAAMRIDDGAAPLALLIHDAAAVGEELLTAVAAVTRTALANSSLEQRVEERAREVDASRRRLVEAEGDERRALQQTLARGPERRLRRVSDLLAEASLPTDHLTRREVEAAIGELGQLANGVHPAELDDGLSVALSALAARSSFAVSVSAEVGRLPEPVEAAAYFVCSEALANAAKHAQADSARVTATADAAWLRVEVGDDGVGGADATGSGLRGLADRVEALGGHLTVVSPRDAGTRILAELPCRSR
jgi:signal transduction histidine kinase